ncbi:hypothetical protein E9531_13545, partial [Lampropedia puyangensis]
MQTIFQLVQRSAQWTIAFITVFALQGCWASEPPECDSQELTTALVDLIEQHAMETPFGAPQEGDPTGLSTLFYSQSTITIEQVVPVGYDKHNERRTCQAVAHMQFPDGDAGQLLLGSALYGFVDTGNAQIAPRGAIKERIEYHVQSANSSGSEFYVQSNMLGLVNLMGFAHSGFVGNYRYAGKWHGTESHRYPWRLNL